MNNYPKPNSQLFNDEKIAIYKPEIIKENPLGLENDTINYNADLMANSNNGFIPIKLESDVVIQRISKDLYANAYSGIRELYNNEARACREAIKTYNAKPQIEITLDKTNRQLIIHGIDSMGMSSKRFLEIFTVLGRSDNFDGNEIGQFGFGRASYVVLGDLALFEVFSRVTNERFAFMGKNGLGFNILPQENCTLDTFGMRITITLYEDISYGSILSMIKRLSMFSGVKTRLINKNDFKTPQDYVDSNYHYKEMEYNDMGSYEIEQTEFKNVVLNSRSKYNHDTTNQILIHIENEDLEFNGVITEYRSYNDNFDIMSTDLKDVFLLGSPIECDLDDLGFSAYILNIKDERKYKPTPDRERMSDTAINEIRKKITDNITEYFRDNLGLKAFSDYQKSENKFIYEHKKTEEMGYFDLDTREIINVLRTIFKIGTKKADTTRFYKLLKQYDTDNIVYVDKITPSIIKLVDHNFPNSQIISLFDNTFDFNILRSLGVKIWNDYLISGEFDKPQKETREIKEFNAILHKSNEHRSSNWSYECIITKSNEHYDNINNLPQKETIIMFKNGQWNLVTRVFEQTLSDYYITKYNKALIGVKNCIELTEFVKTIENNEVYTTRGKMKIKDLPKSKIQILKVDDHAIIKSIKKHLQKDFYVIGTDNELVQIGLYRELHGLEYHTIWDLKHNFKSSKLKSISDIFYYNHQKDSTRISDNQLSVLMLEQLTENNPELNELVFDDLHLIRNSKERLTKLRAYLGIDPI